MKIPFLRLYGGFSVFVLDEAVGVAASLFGFDDDFLDLAKGFKEAPQISIQLFLRKLEYDLGYLRVDVGDKQLSPLRNLFHFSSRRISFILFPLLLWATTSISWPSASTRPTWSTWAAWRTTSISTSLSLVLRDRLFAIFAVTWTLAVRWWHHNMN